MKKRRKVVKSPPMDFPHGNRYSPDIYLTIDKLMGMKSSDRAVVFDIVQGLTNGRAD